MEWKGGNIMDTRNGNGCNLSTDENPMADAYEELIKYNREQNKGNK